ncbi:MAG: MoxR family ATPase [Bacillota bacterium]
MASVQAVREQLQRVIAGQEEVIDQILVAVLVGGHVLLEGVPGLGKTLMVRALARALRVEFRRIQFTPDLMPADVIGTSVFDPREVTFRIRRGPIFTNLLLADEINRTPPRTQAALLEAMEEGQVTIDGESLPLPEPFLVFATQNPIEHEGTYPLPEAQQDRFLLKVLVPYPDEAAERQILQRHLEGFRARDLAAAGVEPVAGPEDLMAWREAVRQVTVAPALVDYVHTIVRATRQWSSLALGAGPRGGIALLAASQALAYLQGRSYVLPDDIQAMALPTLRHRVLLRPEAEVEGLTPDDALREVLAALPVPR